MIIQFTGLSGAGKSSLAQELRRITPPDYEVIIVDGDAYRQTLCRDLGFSKEDRMENIRRLGAEAARLNEADKIVIIAAINPFDSVRKELEQEYDAHTVWIRCDIQTLVERDTKGLYKRALLPEDHPDKLHNLTGINDPYESPEAAHLVIDTHLQSLEESARLLYAYLFESRQASNAS
jgi:adenylylsulfate kinase